MAKYRATIQHPKTPKLRIFKTDDGKFSISYGGEDPIGVRTEATSELDKEIQRLFGYSGWQEYKEKNAFDLKKDVKRDENGRITQAPTVHPFHVAYGLEEFFDNFKSGEYEVVGIPKGLENSNIKYIKAAMEAVDLRDSFFGSKEKGRFGIINIAMYKPEEGLENTNVITRAKEKHGEFEKFFGAEFQGSYVVRHPNGGTWNSKAEKFSDRTDKTEDALVIDIKRALEDSSLLREQKELEEGFIRDATDWVLDQAWELTKWTAPFLQDLEDWSDDVTGGKALDIFVDIVKFVEPSGVASWADVLRAADDVTVNPTDMGAWLDLGFNVLAAIPVAKWAVKGAKFGKTIDKMRDLAKVIRRAPGNVAANKKLSRDMMNLIRDAEKLDPSDVRGMRDYARKMSDLADNVALSPGTQHLARKAAQRLHNVPGRYLPGRALPGHPYRYTRGRFLQQRTGRLTDMMADLAFGEEEVDDGADGYGGSGGWGDDTFLNTDELPDTPISIADMKYFILPKNWRNLGFNWLTRQEKILSQRVGANSEFSMSSFVEPRDDQGATLDGANILIFGHSQGSENNLGGTITRQAGAAGAVVKSYIYSGHADGGSGKRLVGKLENIPSENYTHAFLFLGGNTITKVSKSTLMADAKKKIISHMTDVLRIPKRNILVILPPINLDDEYSRNRKELNAAAAQLFQNMGVKVHSQITGRSKDFYKDGFHIRGGSSLARSSVSDMLATYASPAERRSADNGVPIPYSFIASELGYSRTIWDMYRTEISKIESGGNYSLKGGAGGKYDGRYQIGRSAKKGGARRIGVPNPGHSRSERKAFREDPELQEKIFAGLTVGNHKILMKSSTKYREASSSERLAFLGYAHNQGAGACADWLRTGKVRRDGFGTKGTKFYYAVKKGFANLDTYRRRDPRLRQPAVRGASRVDLASISRAAKESNMKYFGNPEGRPSGKWSSTYTMKRLTSQRVARALGHIPYSGGGWFSDDRISNQWYSDNIIRVPAPISYSDSGPKGTSGTIKTHKLVAPHLLAAIEESRRKYGLPLSHIGSLTVKGTKSGFSAHAWGAAVDLDAYVNPYTVGGLLSRDRIVTVLKGGNYRRYWNFKNSRGQTYRDYLAESLRRGKKAVSLYEFVAGPLHNNGIGKIFNKHGFRWGADWRQARKDVMHFEFMPHYVKGRSITEDIEDIKDSEEYFILTEEDINELA